MTSAPDTNSPIEIAADLFQQKRFAEARFSYAVLQDMHPDAPLFADKHAFCLIALEDWSSALKAWLHVIACHGLTSTRLDEVVQCFIELKSYPAAIDHLQRHKVALPPTPKGCVLGVVAFLGAGEPGRATQGLLEMAALPGEQAIAAFEELLWRLERWSALGNAGKIAQWLERALPPLTKEIPFLRIGLAFAASRARWHQRGRSEQPDTRAAQEESPSQQTGAPAEENPKAAMTREAIKAATREAREKGPKAGYDLLVSGRASYTAPVPQYDATMGAMALRAGMAKEAIAYLENARLGLRAPPAWIYRNLAASLLAMDRAAPAGHNFHSATQAGANILDLNEQLAMEDFPSPPMPATHVDHRHIHGLSFVDEARRLSYLSIPKNACSVLKATFIMNSTAKDAYLASKQTIHEFYPAAATSIDAATAIALQPERILVLRDPLSRLVSCYLNKFARPLSQNMGMAPTISLTIAKVQARLGLAHDLERSISFAEFVTYVSKTPDASCDLHWMPQSRICGEDMSIYTHVGRFEILDRTLAFLQERYGMTPETDMEPHIKFAETHSTRHDPDAGDLQAWTMLPGELRDMTKGYPPSSAFYDGALREIVLRRYAVDARLHAEA